MKMKTMLKFTLGLNLAQAIARLAFVVIGLDSGMQQFIDVQISSSERTVLLSGFAFLGIMGLISVIGMVTERAWGTLSLVLVSIATIAFDIWGMTIQSSAAIGLIVPIISLAYVVYARYTSTDVKKNSRAISSQNR